MAKQDQDKNLYTLSLSIVAVVALVAIVSLVILLTGGRSAAQYVAPSVEQAAPVNNVVGDAQNSGVYAVKTCADDADHQDDCQLCLDMGQKWNYSLHRCGGIGYTS